MADAAQHGEKVNIVVGDSTSNQIDPDVVARAVGGRWLNMSYGKATLQENIELLDRIIGTYPVGEVVWNVPFERVQNYLITNKNEMPRAWKMADEPWLHLFTFESLRASCTSAQTLVRCRLWRPRSGPQGRRRIAYDLYSARVELQGIPWPDEFVARRDEVEQLADKNGVPISYSRMPVHPEMRNLYPTSTPTTTPAIETCSPVVACSISTPHALAAGSRAVPRLRPSRGSLPIGAVAALRHGLRTPVRCEAGLGSGGAHLRPKALAGGDPTLVCFQAERE